MNINWATLVDEIITTSIFSLLGIVIFGVVFFLITKLVPFSMRKEIEEDQNVALGIIIGAVILGIAMIISAILMSPAG